MTLGSALLAWLPAKPVAPVCFSLQVKRDTTVEEVNAMLKEAAEGELKGILGYETKPLV